MVKIDLNLTPNQTFGVAALDVNYNISLRTIDGMTYATISADTVVLAYSVRCIPNHVLLPYPHLTSGGNFYWDCSDGDYPDWHKFNNEHRLLFLTDAELAANVI